MKVSTRTRYGLRFLINLGINYGKGTMQLKEIAEKEQISEKYLEQIVTVLKLSGVIKALRGAYGGYSLAKSPGQITVKELFEILEGGLAPIDCLEDKENCSRYEECVINEFWLKLMDHMCAFLVSYTLEDLVDMYRKKKDLPMFYI
ncbi:MAG: hypothetical protein DKM50_09280 [Candidatus Margulisiibacteriota bacterium]|nr:MAG: hypothetical protein A2X43_02170 [Candidatus Margulisbacteria bacterium GWD2_39_127]OGI00880.1 MAG: hypothetical protein A2X42_03045 [Candidatus Margulisbacteria bacterium GWF2_38_17]OGI08735.1 MAG: hypothetical protein A2X41_05300 [Candidatus Margulisbacteria bacterium GWE2_39_32]PZM79446.1 MAG: hypothetical protein DKM50_09280 [Candidatus Margulisiibacteriota bacterium]HAR63500.1 hypothetical protein [Candidatus Margulisiibacteriota bacterium]